MLACHVNCAPCSPTHVIHAECSSWCLRACAGSVTYAAAVARGLRNNACIVTTARDAEDVSDLDGHDTHVIETNATLTFKHTYTFWGNSRKLQVLQQPKHVLTADDVPARCRMARVVLVGPLTATDVDVQSFTRPQGFAYRLLQHFQHIGVMAQGLQRQLDKAGMVTHLRTPSHALLHAVTPATTVFLSDVETDPWSSEQFNAVVRRMQRLLVTRGARGVSAYSYSGGPVHVPAEKIKPVDTNGAGDTFATGYMLSLAHGKSAQQALLQGTWMASRVCLRSQDCKPDCCAEAVQEEPAADKPELQLLHSKPAAFAEPRLQPEEVPDAS